jgi:hypothetical protein
MNAVGRLVPAVSRTLLAVLLAGALALVPSTGSAAPAAGRPDTLVFVPEADAYVDAAQPSVSFGTSNYLWVDASSVKQSFVKFRLGGVTGRTVTDARLRMYQTDASPFGGNIWSIASNEWDESVTWDSRPAIDGPMLGTFGAVEALTWYDVAVDTSILPGDGPISLAVDSVDSDGARWASREHVSQPQLIVELEPVESDSFTFTPEADAYVDASQPDASFGVATSMWVDASPVKQSFLRFEVAGVAGRTVTGVRLRLRQTDASPSGGRVFGTSSSDWGENVTWNSRPAIDGGLLGTFGAVAGGRWYEADLVPTAVAGDGTISVAIDSANADGARWRSRENVEVPQLIVEVARVDGLVREGLTEVAAPFIGSSDPTFYAGNHRIAATRSGRLLAVYGRHGQGVQLAWRDPGGGWMMISRGEAENGLVLGGTGTGDWVASIAVGTDSSGEEHAWVVWSGSTAQSAASVELRRLSDLDSADGPTVGPVATVSAAGLGNSKVDVALETASDGSLRGCVAWLQRVGSSSWNVMATWFTDLDVDQPAFHDGKVLFNATTGGRNASVVPVAGGLRLVARNRAGRLQVYMHDEAAPLASWTAGARGIAVGGSSVPAGDALITGEVLAAVESDAAAHVIAVQRFSANGGSATVDLQLTGYRDPTVIADGSGARLVMIRNADGFVVSRRYSPGAGWDTIDRIEIGPEGGGNHEWPNVLRQPGGRLRLIVRGPSGGATQTAVLALDRPL